MLEKFRVIFTIPELRQKILLTLLFLAIYRIGWQIPLPMVDSEVMLEHFRTGSGGAGDILQRVAVFSASQLNQATIFGLGIMPYISASIIFQLLGSVYKPLEELKKEGEAGRKKINEYTRYATVGICLLQSWMYFRWLINNSVARADQDQATLIAAEVWQSMQNPFYSFVWQLTAVLTMTAGTVFLMWLGEQIDEFGIGNGISLLIMAGILAGMPSAGWELLGSAELALSPSGNKLGIEDLIILAALFFAVIVGVVYITLGQRRIPMQSAKHVRGRRVFGGQRNYLPLRVNQAGVMPIIFASSLLMIPMLLFQTLSNNFLGNQYIQSLSDMFQGGSGFTYNLLYIALIYFFCYFWTAITFNPKEMADNLKNFGSFIPGYRPGKRTADYLERVMVRITYVGAGFLALVAIVPTIVYTTMNVEYSVASFYGGTGLLIAVSVTFDLVQKIDSHLVMRNYPGLLDKS